MIFLGSTKLKIFRINITIFFKLVNSKSSMKIQPWSSKLHYNVFYVSWNKKTFLTKLNMISYILLVLLVLVSMVLLIMHKFSSSDSFPKPIVSSIGTFNYSLSRFLWDLLSPLVPNDYSCKDTFSFVF